jgi:UDP-glucuronate 4-epimerase
MKVLLTGGAGFIGSHLAERLLARGEDLTIVDNLNPAYDPEVKRNNLRAVRAHWEFRFHETDILDDRSMDSIFEQVRPDKVIHLAAYAGVRPSLEWPARYCDVNVTGTAKLLALSQRYQIKNFVFGSSSSVYGDTDKVPFREDDPINTPASPYAATKRAGELLCYSFHHNSGMNISCLRFFTVYGPRQRPDMAIHKFARLMARGATVPVYAYGESARDYTYVSDIVAGILSALDRNYPFEIFNLGSDQPVKLAALVGVMERALGLTASTERLPQQPGDVTVTWADISKAKEKLDYRPRVSVDDGISRFVNWFRRLLPVGSDGAARLGSIAPASN